MLSQRNIKVLIVDDSLLFRQAIQRGLSSDPQISAVPAAKDPFDARDKLLEHRPDVMVCDVEMPRMNGIDFIRRLLPQYPLPIIVVSSINETVLDAMEAGAVEFVPKPDMKSPRDLERFIQELTRKIKIAAFSSVRREARPQTPDVSAAPSSPRPLGREPLIAIGASTGGIEAIETLLRSLPPNMPGITIVQHIPADFSRMFAERLNATLPFTVREAQDGDFVQPGHVLIAPGNRHMEVMKSAGRYKLRCFSGDKVNGHCPSIDVFFLSVAREAGSSAIGVILTGMGYDGARGLLAMRRRGARTLAQDEASSVVYGMPKASFELGAAEKQVALLKMGPAILSLI